MQIQNFLCKLPNPRQYRCRNHMRTRIRGIFHVIIIFIECVVFQKHANPMVITHTLANIMWQLLLTGTKPEIIFARLDLMTIFTTVQSVFIDILKTHDIDIRIAFICLVITHIIYVVGFLYDIDNLVTQGICASITYGLLFVMKEQLGKCNKYLILAMLFFSIYVVFFLMGPIGEKFNIPFVAPLTEELLAKYSCLEHGNLYDIGHLCCLCAYTVLVPLRFKKCD